MQWRSAEPTSGFPAGATLGVARAVLPSDDSDVMTRPAVSNRPSRLPRLEPRPARTGPDKCPNPGPHPSANGAGNPPAAIECLLTNVTRTNPQVALGSSFSKVTISSAVSSSVTGVPFGGCCDLAANAGTNVAALTTAVPCRTRRRPTIGEFHFGTARPPPINRVCTSAISMPGKRPLAP